MLALVSKFRQSRRTPGGNQHLQGGALLVAHTAWNVENLLTVSFLSRRFNFSSKQKAVRHSPSQNYMKNKKESVLE